MSLWRRVVAAFRRRPPDRLNLIIEPAYAIKASPQNPYFRGIERLARDAGMLGAFVVEADGTLRQGRAEGVPTRHARLMLDVYPNPAAVEGRSVADYADRDGSRRAPRATLELDEGELFLWFERGQWRVSGSGLG